VESDQVPAGLDGVRMMMLVDRRSGKGFGITLYDSEEAMRRGDAALNAMEGGGGQRLSVEFFEVPVQTIDR
jgi:exopolysaccharide biosynthesis protein